MGDLTDRERKREERNQEKRTPEDEREELVKFYQTRGFKKQEAEAIASVATLFGVGASKAI
jgi:hypothetical protein